MWSSVGEEFAGWEETKKKEKKKRLQYSRHEYTSTFGRTVIINLLINKQNNLMFICSLSQRSLGEGGARAGHYNHSPAGDRSPLLPPCGPYAHVIFSVTCIMGVSLSSLGLQVDKKFKGKKTTAFCLRTLPLDGSREYWLLSSYMKPDMVIPTLDVKVD